MEDTKAGKRVRGNMARLIDEIAEKLGILKAFANYEDQEEGDKADGKPGKDPKGTQRVRRFTRTPKVSAPATGRVSPNWSAKVGETIIGNLIRGEGGKFASKRNITSMMNMLADANISPEMFQAMQALMAGEQYTNELILSQLRDAGLVNEANIPTGKANDVIRAIKTAKPENLKAVLKPSGGRGGGGGRAPKPTKEEVEAENISKTGETVVQRGALSEEELEAFKSFADGDDISPEMMEKLKELGLITDKGSLSPAGKEFLSALADGDVRAALDALANAKQEDTVTDKIGDTADALVKGGILSKAEADAFVKFAEGETISNSQADTLVEKGLLAKAGDNYYLTGSSGLEGGRGLWKALQEGKEREAMDAVTKAAALVAAAEGEDGEDGEAPAARLPEQIRQNNIETASSALLEQKVITQDELGGLLNFAAGGNVKDEILENLFNRGLLTKTARGNYVRSDRGKRFLQALEAGSADSAIVALENKSFGAKLFTGKDGRKWLLTWTTNAFEDREEEIFTTRAIESYIKAVEDADEKGTCQFWHIPGTDFATIRWQGGIGRFLVEMSTFDDTKMGRWFKGFFEKYPEGHPVIAPYGWGCSHGYNYRKVDRLDGIYNWFDKKETTILPIDAASNVFTLAEFGFGEKTMELSEKQRNALQVIGNEIGVLNFVDVVTETGKAFTRLLEDSGVQYKSRITKTEDGVEYVASDFLYVPDKTKPSTWKLRIAEGKSGNVTVKQLGRAAAAFSSGGFRGNKVELPSGEASKVKRKLRGEYNKLNVSKDDMPDSIKALMGEFMNLKEFGVKLNDFAKACEEPDMKAEMEDMAEAVEEEPEAVMRRLMELTAQVDNEEMRMEMEALISLLAPEMEAPMEDIPEEVEETPPMAEPMPAESVVPTEEEPMEEEPMEEEPVEEEPMEEEPVEEEPMAEEEPMPEEEPVEEEEEEKEEDEEEDEDVIADSTGGLSMKSFMDEFLKGFDLKGLQAVIEAYGAEIEQLKTAQAQSEMLLAANKELIEKQTQTILELEKSQATKETSEEPEEEVKEEQKAWVPRWGGIQASRARSTVVRASEKELAQPQAKTPKTISSISRHIISGGK